MIQTPPIDEAPVYPERGASAPPRGRRGQRHDSRRAGRTTRELRNRARAGPSARGGAAFGVVVGAWFVAAAWGAATPYATSPAQLSVSGPGWRKAATEAEAKLDSRLLAAVDRLRAGDAPLSVRDAIEVDAEQRILVDMRAEVTPDLLTAIEAGGGAVVSRFPRYDAVRAWAPVAALTALAERDDVRGIRPADRAATR